jgi:hypothetical protein
VTAGGRWRSAVAVSAGLLVATVAAGCGGRSHNGSAPPPAPATTVPVAAPASYQWEQVQQTALPLGNGATTTIADVVAPTQAGQPWLAVGTKTAAGAAPVNGETGQAGAPDQPGTSAQVGPAVVGTATVWTSPDGLHWSATALPTTVPDVSSQARSAARLGHETIVVGATGGGSQRRGAVWVERDGRWREVPPTAFTGNPAPTATGTVGSAASATGTVINTVATGALGAFAAGTIGGAVAMWYSADGVRWTRLPDAEKVIDRSDRPQVNALLVTTDGVLACGSVVEGTDLAAAVWKTTDGIHWGQVTVAGHVFSGDGDHVITSVAPLGTGYVAVGAVRPAEQWLPASWISPDGRSWSLASSAFPQAPVPDAGDQGTVLTGVTSIAGRVVAVGGGVNSLGLGNSGLNPGSAAGLWAAGGAGVQRMWTSTDGLSWSQQALPGAAATATGWRLGVVAAYGPTIVTADTDVGQPRLLTYVSGKWTEVTSSAAPFGTPAPVAAPTSLVTSGNQLYLSVDIRLPGQSLGADRSTVAVLESSDGLHWKLAARGGTLAGHRMRALLAVPGGLAAAGGSTPTAAAHPPAATAWSSPDGRSWTAAPNQVVAGQPVFGGTAANPAQGVSLARNGASLVMVGTDAGSAVAWAQPSGGSWQPATTLDSRPGVAVETVEGACGGPQAVVVVGAEQVGPGSRAAAWSSTDNRSWHTATITPAATAGADETMDGCLATGNAFLAYGASPGTGGTTDPALWQSADGTTWSLQDVTSFSGSGGGGITDLALRGDTWLAVSGAVGDAAAAGHASDSVRLWRSEDAGRTWQAANTQTTPWAAGLDSQADLVGFAGSTPVVVGQIDGGLAVWAGVPVTATPVAGAGASS